MKLPLEPVIHLLHSAPHATLATHSAQMPGYPYITVIPRVLDQHHCPLLLVSGLAEHTKNLLADPRVSVSMVESNAPDVQAAARLTLVGDAERFSPDAALRARYQRFHPEAEQYLQLDFIFFRIVPKRIRYIAGVGKMGWIEHERWAALPPLAPADETPLLALAEAGLPADIEVLGIDRYGIDYRRGGRAARWAWPGAAESAADLAAQVAAFAPAMQQERAR